jgi:hypothetical protein
MSTESLSGVGPRIIEVGTSANTDQDTRADVLQLGKESSSPTRYADAIDILGIVASRRWIPGKADINDPDTTQMVIVGANGLNTIKSPIRVRDGIPTAIKSVNIIEKDGKTSYPFNSVFREVSVLHFMRYESSIATFKRIRWEFRGTAEEPTILPAVETEWSPYGDLADFSHSHEAPNLEIRMRLCQDVVEGLRVLHLWGVVHGSAT